MLGGRLLLKNSLIALKLRGRESPISQTSIGIVNIDFNGVLTHLG